VLTDRFHRYLYSHGWFSRPGKVPYAHPNAPTDAMFQNEYNPFIAIEDDGSWSLDLSANNFDRLPTDTDFEFNLADNAIRYCEDIAIMVVPSSTIVTDVLLGRDNLGGIKNSNSQILPQIVAEDVNALSFNLIRRNGIANGATIDFAGFQWKIKHSDQLAVGPRSNHFMKENVSIENENLVLRYANINGTWSGAEIYTDTSNLGYGKYVFQIANRIDQLDENIVGGIFTWNNNPDLSKAGANYGWPLSPSWGNLHSEIDFEFSRWGDENTDLNAQFVVQHWNSPGNRHQYNLEINNESGTTFYWNWTKDNIVFRIFNGYINIDEIDQSTPLHNWTFSNTEFIPQDANSGQVGLRMNLWCMEETNAPESGLPQEIIIKDFQYVPI